MMELTFSWDVFKARLEDFIHQAELMLENSKSASSDEDLDQLKKQINGLKQEIIAFLKEALDSSNNSYVQVIDRIRVNRFNVATGKLPNSQLIKDEKDVLKRLVKSLQYFIQILFISDAIVRPAEVDIDSRKNFTTEEILEFLLIKLYHLYDDSYHSINSILEGNGIELGRPYEDRELGKELEDLGYVKLLNNREMYAQLTLAGKIYVENRLKSESTDYNKINKSQEELENKIDEIIETLKWQNIGQEVLFNELEELKELYTKLNKKNWGQVLKGKLIDLGLTEALSKEMIQDIFKELTDQVLRLK